MPHTIVTDHDTILMNLISTVLPTSYALFCKYHITKNVRSRLKPPVDTKQIKGEDEKMVKPGVVVEKIMDAWNDIINSFRRSEIQIKCSFAISRKSESCQTRVLFTLDWQRMEDTIHHAWTKENDGLKVMWNTFYHYKINDLIEMDATIARSDKYIIRML